MEFYFFVKISIYQVISKVQVIVNVAVSVISKVQVIVKVAVSVEGGVITKVQVIIEIASQCDQSTSVTGNKKYTVVVHT